MKARISISVKILLLSFLNVFLLALVFAAFARVQYRLIWTRCCSLRDATEFWLSRGSLPCNCRILIGRIGTGCWQATLPRRTLLLASSSSAGNTTCRTLRDFAAGLC